MKRISFLLGVVFTFAVISMPFAQAESECSHKSECAQKSCTHKSKSPHKSKKSHLSFEDMDVNGDGKVKLDEFKTAYESKLVRKFEKYDKNGNGTITKGEYKKIQKKWKKKYKKCKS